MGQVSLPLAESDPVADPEQIDTASTPLSLQKVHLPVVPEVAASPIGQVTHEDGGAILIGIAGVIEHVFAPVELLDGVVSYDVPWQGLPGEGIVVPVRRIRVAFLLQGAVADAVAVGRGRRAAASRGEKQVPGFIVGQVVEPECLRIGHCPTLEAGMESHPFAPIELFCCEVAVEIAQLDHGSLRPVMEMSLYTLRLT